MPDRSRTTVPPPPPCPHAPLPGQYSERGLVAGDAYYVLDAKWYTGWQSAVGYSTALEDEALLALRADRAAGTVGSQVQPVWRVPAPPPSPPPAPWCRLCVHCARVSLMRMSGR